MILQVACGIQKKGELMWKNTDEEPKTKIYITRAFNKHTKCNNKIYCLNLCAQVLYWIKLSFDDSSFHFWVQVIIHSSLFSSLFFQLYVYIKGNTLILLGLLPGTDTLQAIFMTWSQDYG